MNFGWPCYEGAGRQSGYDGANLDICERLYTDTVRPVRAPFYTYNHSAAVVAGETCPTGSSAIAGLAFTPAATSFPGAYAGALFFADNTRDCIWVMRAGTGGQPSPSLIGDFAAGAANPVDLSFGPGGDLFYPDFDGGTIRRISYTAGNQAPIAVARATPTTGRGAVAGGVRRHRLERPGRRRAQLRLGSRRRRRLRRLQLGHPVVDLHHVRHGVPRGCG